MVGTDAKFGVTLGDIMFDDLVSLRQLQQDRRSHWHPLV